MRGRFRLRQLAPGVAAVFAAIESDRRGARIQDVRPRRMDGERPDHRAAVGKAEPLPVIAAVGAAVRAVLRADVDHVRIARMHGDRAHLDVRPAGRRSTPANPPSPGAAAKEPATQLSPRPRHRISCSGENAGFTITYHNISPDS